MNKKKLALLTLALVLIATIGVGATLAYFTDNDSATNTITMGHVDIELKEPNYEGGEDGGEVKDIVPGKVIPKDPTITVQEGSQEAYVRATITLSEKLTDDQAKKLTDDHAKELMDGITILPGWYYSDPEQNGDGYYYYNQKLAAGGKAVLFEEVKIPEKWGNEVADMTFTIDVAAEAIQAEGFTPVTLEVENEDGSTTTYITAWEDGDGNAITAETYKKPAK